MSHVIGRPVRPLSFVAGALFLIGCSADSGNPELFGSGGGGGRNASGGLTALGGQASNRGGAVGQGGNVQGTGQGGLGQAGALVGQGGAGTDLGGQPALGGSAGSGRANGGNSNGGLASGGVGSGGKATGGAARGGASNVGGAATGGKANVGGAPNVGGAATGGKATGGASNQGGSATGGQATGGTAIATGGAAAAGANGGTSPIKVWIAGDSTVQNCSSACPCGWGSQFDALFNPNVTVVNSAVGGRSIQTWLYEAAVSTTMGANGECTLTSNAYSARWTAMTNNSTGMKAGDYLFIQFGINDGSATCNRHVGTALYKTYLGVMAQAAKAAGAQPVFLTPVSAISCSGSNAVGTRGFLAVTKEAGTEFGVPVIDLHQLSVNLYNRLGLCPNDANYAAGSVGAFFCADHTHFEAAGAAQITKVVAQALKDQAIGLRAYLL